MANGPTPDIKQQSQEQTPGFEWIQDYKSIAEIIHEKTAGKSLEQKISFVKDVFEGIKDAKLLVDFADGRFNPFSLFSAFNYQKIKNENRRKILDIIRQKVGGNFDASNRISFTGIPTVSPRTQPYMAEPPERDGAYVKFLWDFFDKAIDYGKSSNSKDFEDLYTEGLNENYLKPTDTMVLYQMNPEVFLPWDSKTRSYLQFKLEEACDETSWKKWKSVLNVKVPSASDYLALIGEVKKNSKRLLGFSCPVGEEFAQLSHAAWKANAFSETFELLESKHQVVLTGAPGTGKTYTAREIAGVLVDKNRIIGIADEKSPDGAKDHFKNQFLQNCFGNDFKKLFPDPSSLPVDPLALKKKVFIDSVQFHPAYDYSDFVIGMKPVLLSASGQELKMKDGKYVDAETGSDAGDVKETKVSFRWKDGVFKAFACRAKKAYDTAVANDQDAPKFVFLIDEINRADLSRVFGELFSLLEDDYRYRVRKDGGGNEKKENEQGILLASGDNFVLPENLYIIGTMNDIDKSVESIDFALRRRFAWKEVTAEDSKCILDEWAEHSEPKVAASIVEKLKNAMDALNGEIRIDKNLGPEYELGGAYFKNYGNGESNVGDAEGAYEKLWDNHIRIILSEYLRDNREKVQKLEKFHDIYMGECWKKGDEAADAGGKA